MLTDTALVGGTEVMEGKVAVGRDLPPRGGLGRNLHFQSFAPSVSGIDNTPAAAPSKVKVLGSADGIHITNANPGDVVSVYGMDGRMVYNQKLSGTQADIALKSNTLYIIKVADKTIKVKL